jgi:hypothetical protein
MYGHLQIETAITEKRIYNFKCGTSRGQCYVLNLQKMRFQVLTAVTMNTVVVFSDVTRWYPSTMNEAAGQAETSAHSSRLQSITAPACYVRAATLSEVFPCFFISCEAVVYPGIFFRGG